MNVYLLVYNESCGTQEYVLDFIDTRTDILNWLVSFPSSVFIVSKKDITKLSKIFFKQFAGGMFVLTLIDNENTDGLLMAHEWEFLNNPTAIDD